MHLVQFLILPRKQRNKIIYPASRELIEMVYFWNADVQKPRSRFLTLQLVETCAIRSGL